MEQPNQASSPNNPPQARRQFSLGKLFAFVAVCGVFFAALAALVDQYIQIDRAQTAFVAMQGHEFGYSLGVWPWPRAKIRLDFEGSSVVHDSGLAHLAALPIVSLNLSHTNVTDDGLEHLGRIGTLECLDLSDTATTDVGVARLRKALPALVVAR